MGTSQSSEKKPDPVELAAKTGRLILASQKLSAVPARVWLIGDRLRSLDLSNNGLEDITSQIGILGKLQTLKLSFNRLTKLPDELYHLSELKVLELDHNLLDNVAAVLPRNKLKSLDLSFNKFTGAVGHPSLAIPPSVQFCNLSNNQIESFTESFGFEMLHYMEELDFDNCSITNLPAACGAMARLSCLKLRNNRIDTLPPELFTGTKLNRLHLEGNPITLRHLETIPGFEIYLERRKDRISKGITQGLHTDTSVCGLNA